MSKNLAGSKSVAVGRIHALAILLIVGLAAGPAVAATTVLYFVGLEIQPPAQGDASRLAELGFVVTSTNDPADLSPSNMDNYDVVVLWQVPAGRVGDHSAALESYVRGGKGLFIHSPGGVGPIDYLPDGFEITVASQELCEQSTLSIEMCVVDDSHPLVNGFGGYDLSAALIQVGAIGPSYAVLARNCACDDPTLAVGTLGEGRIVFDSGFFASGTLWPGHDDYITRLLRFLSVGQTVPAVQDTWGSLKVAY